MHHPKGVYFIQKPLHLGTRPHTVIETHIEFPTSEAFWHLGNTHFESPCQCNVCSMSQIKQVESRSLCPSVMADSKVDASSVGMSTNHLAKAGVEVE